MSAPDPTPDAAPRPSRAERRRRDTVRRRRALLGVVAVLVVAGAATAGVLVFGRDGGGSPGAHGAAAFSDPARAGAALTAARIAVTTLDSYDYRTLAADRAAGLALTTGPFRTAYESSMSGAVAAHAGQYHTVQRCTVQKTGLAALNADGTRAEVLVYGALAVTETGTPTGAAPTAVNLAVTMTRAGDSWQIAAMADLAQSGSGAKSAPGTAALAAAVAAGRQAVLNLMSYRREQFDADFARALAGLAPTAAAQQSSNKASIQAEMQAGSFDFGGSVVEVAVEDAGSDSATLLVSGHRYQQADNGQRTPLADVRSEAVMTRVHGRWLLAQFSTVGTG